VPDENPNLDVQANLDPSGLVSGAAQGQQAITGLVGPLNEAQAAAQKFGVSVDVAELALEKLKAQDKAAQVAALAAAMRASSAATQDNSDATEENAAASDDAAESAERLNNMMREHQQMLMRNAFYVHRLAEGFKDLSMGGRVASQGLMDISESLQYMLGPEMAIYAAIAQVVAMLALMVTMHRRRAGEAAEAAEAEKSAAEKTKDAWSTSVDSLKQSLEDIKQSVSESFGSLNKDAADFAENLHISTDAANALQAALDRLDDAKFGASEAMLNLNEQQALRGKSGEDAELIRNDFNQQRQALVAQHELEKAQREQAEKVNALEQLQEQKKALEDQITAAATESGQLYQKQAVGARMTPAGNVPPSDYQYAKDTIAALQQKAQDSALTPDQWAELASLTQSLPQLQAKQQKTGPQYAEQIERIKKAITDAQGQEGKDLANVPTQDLDFYPDGTTQAQAQGQARAGIMARYQQQIAELQAQLESMSQAQDINTALPEEIKKNDEKIKELADKAKELDGKIAAAQVDIQTAGVGITTATEKGQAGTTEASNTSDAYLQKVGRDNEQKQIQAQIERLQGKLDALPKDDVAGRQSLQEQVEAWVEAKINAKRNEELSGQTSDSLGTIATNKLADAEIAQSRGKLSGTDNNETAQANRASAEQAKRDLAVAEKQLDAIAKTHPELAASVKGITDKTARVAELVTVLATSSQQADRDLAARITKLEGVVNSHQNQYYGGN